MKTAAAAQRLMNKRREISTTATQEAGETLMCPLIRSRQAEAMTTSHFQTASSDICSRGENEAEFHQLHMAWVLADTKGDLRPRLHWLVD